MSLTYGFTAGATDPYGLYAGQTMIIWCPRSELPLTYIPAITGELVLEAEVSGLSGEQGADVVGVEGGAEDIAFVHDAGE